MLELDRLTRRFGRTLALRELTAECEDGEVLAVFGPSGAGKSTMLRLIAGILQPTRGEVRRGGRSLNGLPPEERDMAMCFENYALYSHMSVFDNIAFPLRIRTDDAVEIDGRVREVAALLKIDHLLERAPDELSGGQRQRVALGRAIVRDASVYLLDEPLSHLDAKLRHLMRGELKARLERINATAVYVTHDSREALVLGDRIVVLDEGVLMQIGTPSEVFNSPVNEFVAGFVGEPPMSFLDVKPEHVDARLVLRAGEATVAAPAQLASNGNTPEPHQRVRIGVRALDVELASERTEVCTAPGEVFTVETLGYRNIVNAKVGDGLVAAVVDPSVRLAPGDGVWLSLESERVHVFVDGHAVHHPKSTLVATV